MTPEQFEQLKASVAEGHLERRYYSIEQLKVPSIAEVRVAGDKRQLRGHGSVFNVHCDLGYFIEIVRPGAFSRTIAEDDVRCLFNHDPNYVLGRNRNPTGGPVSLRMVEDEVGLAYENDPAETSVGRDVCALVERGDVSGCSIGFTVRGQEVYQKDDVWYREITDAMLFDVGPVTYPAFVQTSVAFRSAGFVHQSRPEFRSGPDRRVAEEIERQQAALEAAALADLDVRSRSLQLLSAR